MGIQQKQWIVASGAFAVVSTGIRAKLRLVPIRFLLYQFSLLLFVACFTVVFVVDNDFEKRNLIGTDRMVVMAAGIS